MLNRHGGRPAATGLDGLRFENRIGATSNWKQHKAKILDELIELFGYETERGFERISYTKRAANPVIASDCRVLRGSC